MYTLSDYERRHNPHTKHATKNKLLLLIGLHKYCRYIAGTNISPIYLGPIKHASTNPI